MSPWTCFVTHVVFQCEPNAQSRIIFYKVHKLWGSSAWFIDEAGTWARLTERGLEWELHAAVSVPCTFTCPDRALMRMRPENISPYPKHLTLTLLDAHFSLTMDLKLTGVTRAEGHAISRGGLSDRMKQTLSKQGGDIREFSLHIYINIPYHKRIIYYFIPFWWNLYWARVPELFLSSIHRHKCLICIKGIKSHFKMRFEHTFGLLGQIMLCASGWLSFTFISSTMFIFYNSLSS